MYGDTIEDLHGHGPHLADPRGQVLLPGPERHVRIFQPCRGRFAQARRGKTGKPTHEWLARKGVVAQRLELGVDLEGMVGLTNGVLGKAAGEVDAVPAGGSVRGRATRGRVSVSIGRCSLGLIGNRRQTLKRGLANVILGKRAWWWGPVWPTTVTSQPFIDMTVWLMSLTCRQWEGGSMGQRGRRGAGKAALRAHAACSGPCAAHERPVGE